MNEQSIRAWIKVAKKLIRDNKRKQVTEQQNPITKYFPRLTSTNQSSRSPVLNQSIEARNQPSIDDNTINLNMNECSITPALKSPQQHINTPSIATISSDNVIVDAGDAADNNKKVRDDSNSEENIL